MWETKTIKKAGKWSIEITDEGNGSFNIIKWCDDDIIAIINTTKEEIESMMSFIKERI